MSVLGQRLEFDEALSRFRAFLGSQGWPTEIVWARAGDVIRDSSEVVSIVRRESGADSEARKTFEDGLGVGLGVSFEAVCTLADETVAVVAFPADSREAELLMYPSDGGLKMSAAMPRVEGTSRWSSC
jgi:hypothetical protein